MAALSARTNGQNADLLYIGFNQDFGCFAVGTDQGFRIYNCEPFKETFRRDFTSGGIGMVEMLFRCNILALVGGGRNPRYPPHKVMIWDDHQNRCIGELSFRSEVRAVRLRRDKVIVAMSTRVYIYNFADLTLVDHIETLDNPRGLCAVSPCPTSCVLACPGTTPGSVRVDLYDQRKTVHISAHEGELRSLALNVSGSRLATASEKGTLIRIYDTSSGELLQELRRGADKAEIYCIAFNAACTLLACTSDKGTVHIWRLNEKVSEGSAPEAGSAASTTSGPNRPSAGPVPGTSGEGETTGSGVGADEKSTDAAYFGAGSDKGNGAGGSGGFSSLFKGVLPKYFSSEWSFAQFRIPEEGTRAICAFGQEPNTIIVVGGDGKFFKAVFDPEKGGEATRTVFSQFAVSSGFELPSVA